MAPKASWSSSGYDRYVAPNAVVIELNSLLADPISSECRAVYLFCEVRKLLEQIPRLLDDRSLSTCIATGPCMWT